MNDLITTIPTYGFNAEDYVTQNGLALTLWDVGGQKKIRSLWKNYLQNTQGLVFVVDSTDEARMGEAREELFKVVNELEMSGVTLVVMVNKQDLLEAATMADTTTALGLKDLTSDKKWHVQETSATEGTGVKEGFCTLAKLIKNSRKPA